MSVKRKIIDLVKRSKNNSSIAMKRRVHYISKFFDALDSLNISPSHINNLNRKHIEQVVAYLIAQNYSKSHVLNMLTEIRYINRVCNLKIDNVTNGSFGVKNKQHSRPMPVNCFEYINLITNDIAKLIFSLEIYFGLTYKEAISIIPSIHHYDDELLITREISSTNKDRTIPIHNTEQRNIIKKLNYLLPKLKSISSNYSSQTIKKKYRDSLVNIKLNSSIEYRYFYAIQRLKTLPKANPKLIISHEMGVNIRTVRSYINE